MAFKEIVVSASKKDPGGMKLREGNRVATTPGEVKNFETHVYPVDIVIWIPDDDIEEIVGITPSGASPWNVFQQGPAPVKESAYGRVFKEGAWFGVVGNGHPEFPVYENEPYTIAYTVKSNGGVYKGDPKIQLHRPPTGGGGGSN